MKKKILVLLIISFFLFYTDVFAQNGYVDKINQLNNNTKKEGLWIKEDKYHKYFMYYLDGILNGPYYVINTTKNVLSCFGQFLNGEYSGTWYYFGDYGHLMMIQKDFRKNTYIVPKEHNSTIICPHRCYCITYYSNGGIESEGILLWDEDPESDFTFEYGEWKYYDQNGNLTKMKMFE